MPTTVLDTLDEKEHPVTVNRYRPTQWVTHGGRSRRQRSQPRRGSRAAAPFSSTGLLGWTERFPERTWAIENATGLGYLLAQQLVAAGERVVVVQPKLAARVRLLAAESTNKNDPHDALSVAIAAPPLEEAEGGQGGGSRRGHEAGSRRHRTLSSARIRIACRLHAVLCDLVARGRLRRAHAEKAALLRAHVEPHSAVAAARVELAGELLDDLRRVDHQLTESAKRLEQVVTASGTTTIGICGVGPVVGATVVGITTDIARFPTRDRFAEFNGTDPSRCPPAGARSGGCRAGGTAP